MLGSRRRLKLRLSLLSSGVRASGLEMSGAGRKIPEKDLWSMTKDLDDVGSIAMGRENVWWHRHACHFLRKSRLLSSNSNHFSSVIE